MASLEGRGKSGTHVVQMVKSDSWPGQAEAECTA